MAADARATLLSRFVENIMAPKKSPRRSPRLTKKDRDRLTTRQAARLQKTSDSANDARSYADAMKLGASAQREHIKGLQAELAGIQDSLSKHPLLAKKAAKKEQISVAKSDLADIVQELNGARAKLQAKLDSKNAPVVAPKGRVHDDVDDGDDDG